MPTRTSRCPSALALAAALASAFLLTSCATLQDLGRAVAAPRFRQAPDHDPELRLLAPSREEPNGGAAVRLWLDVENPNPFGVTLSYLSGALELDEARTATAEFPLGLPLRSGENTVIPLDLRVSFSELPGVARALGRAVGTGEIPYRLEGIVGVETPIGRPTFGPMTIVAGRMPLRGLAGFVPRVLPME